MSTTLLELRPAQIAPHPSNPRRDVGDLSELAASIKNRGVLQALVVAPVPEGHKGKAEYILIAGHRRLAAAKASKLKTVPATVREDLTDPADQLAAMLEENGHRADLTPVEEAFAVQGLLDLGLTQAQVAARTGMKKSRVSERARLAKLPAAAQEQVHTHQASITDALRVMAFADRPDLEARALEALGSGDNWLLTQLERRLENAKAHEAERKTMAAAGVRVLDARPADPGVDGDAGDDSSTAPAGEWWELGDLLDGSTEVDEVAAEHTGVDQDSLEWEHIEAWHAATCEGHAVFSEDYPSGPQWISICTTPEAHSALVGARPGTPAGGVAPTEDAAAAQEARDARRAEEARLKEAFATAASLRRSHVHDLLTSGADLTEAAESALRTGLRAWWKDMSGASYRHDEREVLAAWLGASGTGDLDDKFLTYVDKASLPQLALLNELVTAARSEDLHSRYWGAALYHPHWRGRSRYRDLLGGPLAYEWSEFEQSLMPAAQQSTDEVAS